MLSQLKDFQEFISNPKNFIPTSNQNLVKVVNEYKIFYCSDEIIMKEEEEIKSRIKESKVVVINKYEEAKSETKFFFLFGFKNYVIIIESNFLSKFVKIIQETNSEIEFSFISDKNAKEFKEIFTQNIKTNSINDEFFQIELNRFNEKIFINKYEEIWKIIFPCISGYLIKQSYSKTKCNRIEEFNKNQNQNQTVNRIFYDNDFIELREIGTGGSFNVKLIYHIKDEQFYVIKKPYLLSDEEKRKLYDREKTNYQNIQHPNIPKYYGITKDDFIVIEFINGKTLKQELIKDFSESDKIKMIFHLLRLFDYLHSNEYVYRDLKPDNIMIDENKTIILIDFDRMIKISDNTDNEEITKDFQPPFVAPEVNQGNVTFQNDIYSIGKIILFILNLDLENKTKRSDEYQILCIFVQQCIDNDYSKRPSISRLVYYFYSIFINEIDEKLKTNKYFIDALFKLGSAYYEGEYISRDINKSIYYYSLASEQNNPKAQYNLGLIYEEGEYISRDINKSIYYYSLAANQNYSDAQYNLGLIYYEGEYISLDINKAIYYFTLAANQNNLNAQYNLGLIYYESDYISHDINKSIYYFSLAANQNHSDAQYNLGLIYYLGEYIPQDIKKSIYYFSLASDQNDPKAQYNLGLIYYEGEYISCDINKSIYYFSLASDQNDPNAQFYLGLIYYSGEYISRDINKSIYYFSLASDQDHSDAQFYLGLIYNLGQYIPQDINKSIYYFSLAADQNDSRAQYNLGLIYEKGEYISRDINKSIYYYSLAADQNDSRAQYNLGLIYENGKYIPRDINKSIYYYSLASEQNDLYAQFHIGLIYYSGEYVSRDINKSVHYFSLAANQNNPNAQFYLGLIYYLGQYISRDINKSIYYFSLASNQNNPEAHYNLGLIYYSGEYVSRDINKSIHYFSLASDQNDPNAQYNLGVIYHEGQYITRDINKSIYYFSLAANQNHSDAQFYLGLIYHEGQYIPQDINKSIYYYSLASDQNNPRAQNNIGLIYEKGENISHDINKSIYYYSLAANQNIPEAQFNLGILYLKNFSDDKSFIKGIDLLIQSSSNGDTNAHFFVGYFYQEGKHVPKDIKKSIHHYKEASSFNNQYAKNNLGIIYKNGNEEGTPKNIGYAIEYFEEAIRQKEDKVSMYNLSHIYIYEIETEEKIEESINILIKSLNYNFSPCEILLCISLIKKYSFDFDNISKFLSAKTNKSKCNKIISIICQELYDEESFEKYYEKYKTIDFIYNYKYEPIESKSLFIKENKQLEEEDTREKITKDFYEGFGYDI